jgi:SAM-dependent methyltransferase
MSQATITPDETVGHYSGDKGKAYFDWQGGAGDFFAKIVAHKFRPYVSPADCVLDFGCGGGFLLNTFDCRRRVGVEVNPFAREHANGLGVECHHNLDEVQPDTADVIISHHALEHVLDPIGTLRALRTRLKPGKHLVLVVPIDNFRLQKVYDPEDRNHHLFTWTSQLLGNCLFEAGYEIVDIKYRVHMWPRRWTMALYNRLPLKLFDLVCYLCALATGKGRELLAVARRPAS